MSSYLSSSFNDRTWAAYGESHGDRRYFMLLCCLYPVNVLHGVVGIERNNHPRHWLLKLVTPIDLCLQPTRIQPFLILKIEITMIVLAGLHIICQKSASLIILTTMAESTPTIPTPSCLLNLDSSLLFTITLIQMRIPALIITIIHRTILPAVVRMVPGVILPLKTVIPATTVVIPIMEATILQGLNLEHLDMDILLLLQSQQRAWTRESLINSQQEVASVLDMGLLEPMLRHSRSSGSIVLVRGKPRSLQLLFRVQLCRSTPPLEMQTIKASV